MLQLDKAAIEQAISSYCGAWGEPDPAQRRAILERVWAADATYADPTVHVSGLDGLVGHISNVLTTYPGGRIERTTNVDAHHGWARFGWHMLLADGTSLPDGIDIAEIGGDGKLRRILGFFGALRARPSG